MAISSAACALLPTIEPLFLTHTHNEYTNSSFAKYRGIYPLAKCKLTNQSIKFITQMIRSTCKRDVGLFDDKNLLIISFLAGNHFETDSNKINSSILRICGFSFCSTQFIEREKRKHFDLPHFLNELMISIAEIVFL